MFDILCQMGSFLRLLVGLKDKHQPQGLLMHKKVLICRKQNLVTLDQPAGKIREEMMRKPSEHSDDRLDQNQFIPWRTRQHKKQRRTLRHHPHPHSDLHDNKISYIHSTG